MEWFCRTRMRHWRVLFVYVVLSCAVCYGRVQVEVDGVEISLDPNFTKLEHFAVKLHQYKKSGPELDPMPDLSQFYGVLYVEVLAEETLENGFVKLSGGPESGLMQPCSGCTVRIEQSYSCHRQRLGSGWAGVNGTQLWGQEINPVEGVEVVEVNHPDVFAIPGRAVVVADAAGEPVACGRVKPIVHASSQFADVVLEPVEAPKAVASFLFYQGFEDLQAKSFGSISMAQVEQDGEKVEGLVRVEWSLKSLTHLAQGDIFVSFDHQCYHDPESLVNATIESASVVHWESDAQGNAGGSAVVNLTSKGSLFDTFEELVELTFVIRDQTKRLPIACGNLIYTPNTTGYIYAMSDAASDIVRIRGSAIGLEAVHQFGFKSITFSINRGITCAAPGYSSTQENERWHTPYAVTYTADGSGSIAQIERDTKANIFSTTGIGFLGHAVVLKSSNDVDAACGVLQRLSEDPKVTVAPTPQPTSPLPTAQPTTPSPTNQPAQSTPRPTIAPSASPTIEGLGENATDRTYVIVTLIITGAVVCCTCRRGMRRRSDGRRYSNVDEYGDHGIELGIKDSLQTKDLLAPMETASSRDLDVI